ncbi:MAG: 2-oxo acid dehydrogenase subunit E2 [Actinobacteria bacterium]|nr:2-oxo acid dehydrogenase subunit E2 [Actinomycetota bacterium]
MTEATPTNFDFRLPDVGEGLEDAEILRWMVIVGQEIEVNQVIVEIESAKSLVELPSPFAGTIVEILVPAGQVIRVGTPIVRIQLHQLEKMATQSKQDKDVKVERTEILVGSGPRTDDGRRRRLTPRNFRGSIEEAPNIVPAVKLVRPLAKPLVRKMARELGIDLTLIHGSGPEGSVTRDDVRQVAGEVSDPSTNTKRSIESSVESSRETRVPIRGVRRATAEAMVASAFTAPHVTEFVTVDVTPSMHLLEALRQRPEFSGVRLSILTLLARAMCLAASRTPEINSYWDASPQEIVLKHYVNLGIATATDRGLLVPHIKDADQLSLKEMAIAIGGLVDVARAGRTQPHQMIGGTMSITNIGVFGIESGTPILPPGESAIVSLGAVVERPWVVEGEIAIRQVTTLALSFDHRLVDGAQGSRFLADVAGMLHTPEALMTLPAG